MKIIPFLSLILVISILGCNKPTITKPDPIENSVLGKWTYTEYFYRTGAQGQWRSVTQANQTIEFKPDSSFISIGSFLNGVTKYDIVDSVTIKFQSTSTPSGYILMGYLIKTTERELYLYPVNPICIEGCNNKFKR